MVVVMMLMIIMLKFLNWPLVWAEPKLEYMQGHIQYLDERVDHGGGDDDDDFDDDDDDAQVFFLPWCGPAEWLTSCKAKAPF